MSHYRLKPILFAGLILILFVVSGWLLINRTSDYNAREVAFKPTHESSSTPTSEPIDLLANFNQWRQNHPAFPLHIVSIDDYPLFVPHQSAINIPPYPAGYDPQIVNIAIPENESFIAINYSFRESVGGGTSAYAAYYGWDLDQQVGVLYVTRDTWGCVDKDFRDIVLNNFNLENGLFLIMPDKTVIKTDATMLEICETSSE